MPTKAQIEAAAKVIALDCVNELDQTLEQNWKRWRKKDQDSFRNLAQAALEAAEAAAWEKIEMTNYAQQVPIEVRCRCSWRGMTDKLIGRTASSDLHCPRCLAVFVESPSRPTPSPSPD